MVGKLVALAVAGSLAVGVPAVATANGTLQVARYRQITETSMPERVVIRCHGWAEDSAARLTLVDISPDRAVYRCATP